MYHVIWHFAIETRPIPKIALLRVISTMKINILSEFLTSHLEIFYGIHTSSDILLCNSDILSGILSRVYYRILFGIRSDILFDFFSGTLSDMSFWHFNWHLFWQSLWHARCRTPTASARSQWAVPPDVWRLRFKSGSPHWGLEFAVEVRQCHMGSGARSWGPGVHEVEVRMSH